MSFLNPQLLPWVLLAPFAGLAALWLWRRHRAALRQWATPASWRQLGLSRRGEGSTGAAARSVALLVLVFLALPIALARPRWGAASQVVERRGVDVIFVLDTSLSMAALDARPTRLAVAQALLRTMVDRLPGHRYALLRAEGAGEVLIPLTTDAAALDLVVTSLDPGSSTTPGTSLANALIGAVELFSETAEAHRVAMVISDGEDHVGGLPAALRRLQAAGVVVHAIGVGSAKGAPIPLPPDRRNPSAGADYKRDGEGRLVITRRNDTTLRTLAVGTGGLYLTAENGGGDPTAILDRVDQMERRGYATMTIEAQPERYQWPLAVAAAALLLLLWRRRSPAEPGPPGPPGPPRRAPIPSPLAPVLVAALLSAAAAPAPWIERWIHTPYELTQRGMESYRQGHFEEAARLFASAQRLAPDDATTLFNAGSTRMARDPATAIELLTKAAAIADAAANANALTERSGDPPNASRLLAAQAWFNLANGQLAVGDPAAAAHGYRQALRRQADHYGAKHNLELALRALAAAPSDERPAVHPEPSQPSAEPTSQDPLGMEDDRGQERDPNQAGNAPAPQAPEPPPRQPPTPSPFEPQETLSTAQAEALLDAVEALERTRRRQQAERQRLERGTSLPRGKDW